MGANILGFSTTVPSADPVSSTPSLNPQFDPATTVAAELLQGPAVVAEEKEVVLNNGLKKATMIIEQHTPTTPPVPLTVNIDLTDAASINQSVADINTTIRDTYTAAEMTAVVSATPGQNPGDSGKIEFIGSLVGTNSITFAEDKINTVANATVDANGFVTFKDNDTKAILSFTDTTVGAGKDESLAAIDPTDIDAAVTAINGGTSTHGLVAEVVAQDDGNGGTIGVIKLRNAVVHATDPAADLTAAPSNQHILSSVTSDRTPNQMPITSASDSASSTAAVGISPRTSVGTASEARTTIVAIDAAIQTVNMQRSNLGAVSNRLSHTVNNLTNISTNLSAAQGGIEDADFAHETTMLAKNQILQQASTAMLAQANASKQNVLSLLQG
jgi:flagellin